MAIPEHRLSTTPVIGYYLVPDNEEPSPLIDYEYGGIALQDPSEGLFYQIWHARLERNGITGIDTIYIGADSVEETVFYQSQNISNVSLAFDQNMNAVLAYTEGNEAKFRWWDTTIADYVITTLPSGSRSPKCCLDDKRVTQRGSSDILLVYCRDTTLYYREQRDRYTVEYTLKEGIAGSDVLVVGMTNTNRVQIALGLMDYPPGQVNYRTVTSGVRRKTVDGKIRRLVRLSYG